MEKEGKALEILRKLASDELIILDDLIYDVKEREGKGWKGKKVIEYSNLIQEIKEVIK